MKMLTYNLTTVSGGLHWRFSRYLLFHGNVAKEFVGDDRSLMLRIFRSVRRVKLVEYQSVKSYSKSSRLERFGLILD